MEFSDLDSDVEVGDWLINGTEISKRRLIRRTPNYNIYKADWFGDVLVYEPNSKIKDDSTKRETTQCHLSGAALSCGDLNVNRLIKLNLNLSKSNFQHEDESFEDQQHDSAYSSLSSTPEYHHKSEFKFPASPTGIKAPLEKSICEPNRMNEFVNVSEGGSQKKSRRNSAKVILNKGSFDCISASNQLDVIESRDPLSELNELRLIAHEGFMLFLGASIESYEDSCEKTSLVIQMNHPSTISLFELLHHGKNMSSPSTPNRFFENHLDSYLDRQTNANCQLGVEARLNICQQVTNAMTYLHDKNIVHGKLTSVNIYIELNQRVKISLIDHDENAMTMIYSNRQINPTSKHGSIQFNLPALTYLSPELIRTIKLTHANNGTCCDHHHCSCETNQPLVEIDSHNLTKRSDIFSFGTLLFELFEERYPFAPSQTRAHKLSPTSWHQSPLNSPAWIRQIPSNGNINICASQLIYQIGSGLMAEKNLCRHPSSCSGPVAHIIDACWSTNPEDRPQFKQLTFA